MLFFIINKKGWYILEAIEAVNPFLENIPENLRRDYMFDTEAIILKKKLSETNPNGTQQIKYKLLVATANKPLWIEFYDRTK